MSVIRSPKFFKFRRPKSFEYQPLYYNEQEEAAKEREERMALELKMEASPYQRIHEGFLRAKVKQEHKQRTFRLALIITVLITIAFLLTY